MTAHQLFDKGVSMVRADCDYESLMDHFTYEIITLPEPLRTDVLNMWLEFLKQPLKFDGSDEDILEEYATLLVGEARYRPAIPIALARFEEYRRMNWPTGWGTREMRFHVI